MSDDIPSDEPAEDEAETEEILPPHQIEGARSSRSRCRSCRRKIEKGVLRIGVLLEGPYGTGYLWHHLSCAAKRRFEDIEEAYTARAWAEGVEVPPLEELRALRDKAAVEEEAKQSPPYVERAPSGRSRCKHCGETIEQGAFRVVLARTVEFYGQYRAAPIKVHASCVAPELAGEDSCIEVEGFAAAVRASPGELSSEDLDSALAEIGTLD